MRFVFVIGILLPLLAHTQSSIGGRVTTPGGEAVAYASVKIFDSKKVAARFFALTDKNGVYSINAFSLTQGWLIISAAGYQDYEEKISFENNGSLKRDIVLHASAKELPAVTIRNKPSVRVSGDTTSFLVESFRYGNENNIGELLDGMPGFQRAPGGLLIYNGKIINRVLINGDDITGRDYSQLVNSLRVEGIESMEVINNYSAADNLLSRLFQGTGQVLNISYKKGLPGRIIGSVAAGIGIPGARYDLHGQGVGLFKKAKFIANTSSNSLGRTYQFQDGELNWQQDSEDNEMDFAMEQLQPAATVYDPTSMVREGVTVTKNRSASSFLHFLVRPSSRLSFKGVINHTYDRLHKMIDNSNYYNTSNPFLITSSQQILNKLGTLDGLVNMNYFLSPNSQILVTWKYFYVAANTGSYTAVDQAGETEEQNRFDPRQNGLSFTFNRLMKNQAGLQLTARYKTSRVNGSYQMTPFFIDFFRNGEEFDLLYQSDRQWRRGWEAGASFSWKKSGHSYTITAYVENDNMRNNAGIELVDGLQTAFIHADSLNRSVFRRYMAGLRAAIKLKLSDRAQLSLLPDIQYFDNRLIPAFGSLKADGQAGWLFLPGVHFQYQFSKESSLSMQASQSARFPASYEPGLGYTVKNNTGIQENPDSLVYGLMRMARATWSYGSLIKRKSLFFTTFSYIETPQLWLPQLLPAAGYTVTQYYTSEKRIKTGNLNFTGQKYFNGFRTQITSTLQLSVGNMYTRMQQEEQPVDFSQHKLLLAIRHNMGKSRLHASVQYGVTTQRFVQKTVNREWVSQFLFSQKLIVEKLLFAAQLRYSLLLPQGGDKISMAMVSTSLQYNPKNSRWQYRLQGDNLFNQRKYTRVSITDQAQRLTAYQLFPRCIWLQVRFDLQRK